MLRSDLITLLIHRNPHLNHPDVDSAVRVMLEQMVETLAADDRIEIRGFGSFTLRHRSPRTARNPKTGESVLMGKHSRVHFKPGLELRERVNESK